MSDAPREASSDAALSISIDWMTEGDLPWCGALDRDWRPSPSPVLYEDFRELMRGRNVIGLVAKRGEPASRTHPWSRRTWAADRVGFIVYLVNGSSLDVLRTVVSPIARRRGIGRTLIETIQRKLSGRRPVARYRVEDDNLEAHLWLRALGWRCEAVEGSKYVFEWRNPQQGGGPCSC